jgi:hypothetical protein
MDLNIIPDNIIKGHREGEFFTNCPFCYQKLGKVDDKFHLGFNILKKVYNCLRCQSRGRLSDLKELSLLSGNTATTFNDLKNKINKIFLRKRVNLVNLDEISCPITKSETPFAYKYLLLRGFTDQDIEKYNIRVGMPFFDESKDREVRKWVGRILFPFFNISNECTYVVGRSYNGKEPRYINTEGSKSAILYNINNVNGKVIICEGIVSSIFANKATGVSAVALLGKTITDYQVNLLKNKTNEVYLSLDADTTAEEQNKVIIKLLKADIKVNLIKIPLTQTDNGKLKDPADYKDGYQKFFSESESISRTSLNMSTNSIIM